jgi:hypothetical protein
MVAQIISKLTKEGEGLALVVFYSMDNKAKINIGEPHIAVIFGGRGRCNILPTDANAIADDHDFKVMSLTPSVTLCVDTSPDKGENGTSFYGGESRP